MAVSPLDFMIFNHLWPLCNTVILVVIRMGTVWGDDRSSVMPGTVVRSLNKLAEIAVKFS